MRRSIWIGCGLMALAACTGCETASEQTARLLVVPARLPGQFMEVCAGTRDRLLETEQIDAHYRVATDPNEGVEIDCWVIKSRLVDEASDNTGSIFATKLTRGTVVVLHPLLTGKAWFLRLGNQLADRGWDVILMDLRGHGFSGGDYITWGAKEKRDVKAVVDHVVAHEAVSDRVYAFGSSMGGAVAVQYAAIDDRCKGVIALSPPLDAINVFRRILCLTTESQFQSAVIKAGEIAGFNPAEASTLAAAQQLDCPIVLVHGAWDLLIPATHSEAIFDTTAAPRKRLVRMRFAGHIVEVGRDRWLADQMDSLAAMEGETTPKLIALRVLSEPNDEVVHVIRQDGPAAVLRAMQAEMNRGFERPETARPLPKRLAG